jgi:methionine salvage enolase-phosphatase E1
MLDYPRIELVRSVRAYKSIQRQNQLQIDTPVYCSLDLDSQDLVFRHVEWKSVKSFLPITKEKNLGYFNDSTGMMLWLSSILCILIKDHLLG